MMTTAAAFSSTTTTTVTTVTAAQAGALSALATLLLIGLLVAQELVAAYAADARTPWRAGLARRLREALLVGVVPLLLIFTLVIVTKVRAVL